MSSYVNGTIKTTTGTATAPSYTFAGNTNTGLYNGTNTINATTNGTLRVTLDTASLTSTLPIYATSGSAGAPAYAFSSDPDTGIYGTTAELDFGTSGVNRAKITDSAVDIASTNITTFNNTTDSTITTDGSVVIKGGLGVAKNITSTTINKVALPTTKTDTYACLTDISENAYGKNWQQISSTSAISATWNYIAMNDDAMYILACSTTALYISKNNGASFTEISPTGSSANWLCAVITPDAGTMIAINNTVDTNNVCISTDKGTTWVLRSITGTLATYLDCSGNGQYIYCGPIGTVYRSADYGATFASFKTGLTVSSVHVSHNGRYLSIVNNAASYGDSWYYNNYGVADSPKQTINVNSAGYWRGGMCKSGRVAWYKDGQVSYADRNVVLSDYGNIRTQGTASLLYMYLGTTSQGGSASSFNAERAFNMVGYIYEYPNTITQSLSFKSIGSNFTGSIIIGIQDNKLKMSRCDLPVNTSLGLAMPTVSYPVTADCFQATNGTFIENQGLHLQWNKVSGTGKSYVLNNKGGGPGGMIFGDVSSADVITEWMTLDTALKSTLPIYVPSGTAAAPSYTFSTTNAQDTGMYLIADDQLAFSTAGTKRFEISSTVLDVASTNITTFNNTTDSSLITNGSVIVKGGLGVSKTLLAKTVKLDGASTSGIILTKSGAGTGQSAIDFRTASGYGLNMLMAVDALHGTGISYTYSDFNSGGTVLTGTSIDINTIGKVGIGGSAGTEPLEVTGNIKSTGVVKLPSGTAAAPSYTFSTTNAQDTGMYLIADDQLAFSTGGTKRFEISGTVLDVASTNITTFNNTTDSTILTDGSVILKGGLSVAKSLCVPTLKIFNSTYKSTFTFPASLTADRSIKIPNTDVDLSLVTATPAFTSVQVGSGAAATPSYSFSTDPNTGFYADGADGLYASTNGTQRLALNTTSLTSTLPIYAQTGTAAAPAYTFSGDTNTGLFGGTDNLYISIGGTQRTSVSTTAITSTIPIYVPSGTAATPSYTFSTSNAQDTGMFLIADNDLGFSTDGVQRASISKTAITSTLPIYAPYNSVGAPAYTFSSDPDTGIYGALAEIDFGTSGVYRAKITDTAVDVASTNITTFNNTTDSTILTDGSVILKGGLSVAKSLCVPTLKIFNSTYKSTFTFPASLTADRSIKIPNTDVDLSLVTATPAFTSVQVGSGAAATPSYSFSTDPNTGFYTDGADGLYASTNGTQRLALNTTSLTSTLPIYVPSGTAAAPSYTFSTSNAQDNGMYLIADGQLAFSTGGTKRFEISNTVLDVASTNITTFNNTTDSTLTTDGSVIVKGGLGVAKTLLAKTVKLDGASTSGIILTKSGAGTGQSAIDFRTAFGYGLNMLMTVDGDHGTGISYTYNDYNTGKGVLSGTSLDINTIGNVGIGQSASSNNRLEVSGNVNASSFTAGAGKAVSGQGLYLQWNKQAGTGKSYVLNNKGGGPGGMIFGDVSSTDVITEWMSLDTALKSTLPIYVPSGTAAAPSYTFSTTSAQDTGMYLISDNNLGFSTNGTKRMELGTAAVSLTYPIYVPSGTAAAPSYTFSTTSAQDTGMYLIADDQLAFSTAGTKRFEISSTVLDVASTNITTFNNTTDSTLTTDGAVIIKGGLGIAKSLCVPTLNLFSGTKKATFTFPVALTADRSIKLPNADVDLSTITANPVFTSVQVASGTATAPSYTFSTANSQDTGMYLVTEKVLGFTANGVASGRIDYSNNITSFGFDAGNGLGASTTAIGYTSLRIATGVNNTGVGYGSGVAVSTGTNNTCLGYDSGKAITTGAYNTCLGTSSNCSATGSYQLALGYNVNNTTANSILIGQSTNYTAGISLAVKTGIGQTAGTEMLEVAGNVTLNAALASTAQAIKLLHTGTYGLALGVAGAAGQYLSDAVQHDAILRNENSGQAFLIGCGTGASTIKITSSSITTKQPIYAAAGTAAAPSYTFSTTNAQDTGMYLIADDQLAFSTAGNKRFEISSTSLTSTIPIYTLNGTATVPAYAFSSDTNTGFYGNGSDGLYATTGGTQRLALNTTSLTLTLPIYAQTGGTSTDPAYAFSSDTNTGFYGDGSDGLYATTGGTQRLALNTTSLTSTLPIYAPAGTAAAPAYTFSSDTDTGIYSIGANILGFAINGAYAGRIDTGNTSLGYNSCNTSVGSNNTCVGLGSGSSIVSSGNTCIGTGSGGATLVNGEYNTIIGGGSTVVSDISYAVVLGTSSSAYEYGIAIGVGVGTSAYQSIVMGRGAINQQDYEFLFGWDGVGTTGCIAGTTSWYATSDRRLKKNIVYTEMGLDFINSLKPCLYQLNHETTTKNHFGLIAQDVVESMTALGITTDDFEGIGISDDYYNMSISSFIPALINSVKQLKTLNNELTTQLNAINARLTALETK